MDHFLEHYGLLAVYLGAATEGDGTVTLAGALAHLRYFPFLAALVAGWAGGLSIDWTLFAVGRRFAATIRSSRVYRRAGPTVESLVARVGLAEILVARFILGARMPSMVFWGSQGVPFWRFAAFDAVGCAVWAGVLVSLGYFGSVGIGRLLGPVDRSERHLLAVLGVAVLTALVFGVVGIWVRRDLSAKR